MKRGKDGSGKESMESRDKHASFPAIATGEAWGVGNASFIDIHGKL